ncbi:MAG: FkbM family methyltransferase [bacterium]
MIKKLIRRKIHKRIIKFMKKFTQEKGGLEDYQVLFNELHKCSIIGLNIGGTLELSDSGEDLTIKNMINMINMIENEDVTIFDVGANVGNYSTEILKGCINKKLYLHAFEPSKATFEKLNKNINNPNVKLNNFGLSDKEETLTLYKDTPSSDLASLYDRKIEHFNINLHIKEEVELKTLDLYCQANNINYIDVLKLDVEGHEFNVLNGAKNMLNAKKIKIIQFEFGGCNVDSRTFFRDFWYLLKENYKIYRVLRDGLFEFTQYEERQEILIYSNFIAVIKED